ncbi:cobyrinate a,c-diamide synthase [Corynebacterium sp. 335C]
MVTGPAASAIVIGGAGSGTGKTTLATGIMAALARRMEVAPFKVGPDYIDPGYHGVAAGRPGRNLDSVMCGRDLVGPLYAHGSAGCDIGVVEGVMGLYDGRIGGDPLAAAGSTAEIAGLLGAPVVLVVDARHMSQSVAALVHGFATLDDGVRVAGAIVNHVGSARHAQVCRDAVEAVGVPVLGEVPRVDDIAVPSRHLGLVTAEEHGGAAAVVGAMADLVERHVDLEGLLSLAARPRPCEPWDPAAAMGAAEGAGGTGGARTAASDAGASAAGGAGRRPRIAVASGAAFTFAYAEHAEMLAAGGADVVTFDPLTDDLPDLDGLVVPGGFPEEHAAALAARADLAAAVREAVAGGAVVHGECAGLLWLLEELDGHRMCGVVPGAGAMTGRLTLGYREAVALGDSAIAPAGLRVTGHEFHRTRLDAARMDAARAAGWTPAWGWRDWRGEPATEGLTSPDGRVHASYLHLHPAGAPEVVRRFLEAARAR